jgi:hypothetical protein
MKKSLLIFLFFLLSSSCATQKISTIQEENCYDFKEFTKFHRCAERLTKDTYQYKFSFDKDIINAYFAYGEVLAIDVEKGRKDNFEAFKIWGEELEKSVDESREKGARAIKTAVVTAIIAIAVYSIYKEYLEDKYEIEEISQARNTTSNSINRLNPVAQGRCTQGRAILSVYKRYTPFLSSCSIYYN